MYQRIRMYTRDHKNVIIATIAKGNKWVDEQVANSPYIKVVDADAQLDGRYSHQLERVIINSLDSQPDSVINGGKEEPGYIFMRWGDELVKVSEEGRTYTIHYWPSN